MPAVPEMSLEVEGCRDLVVAIFRLAVCDLLGRRYGYDGPVSYQKLTRDVSKHRHRAEAFLLSDRASDLAAAAGFSAIAARHEVRRLLAEVTEDPTPT